MAFQPRARRHSLASSPPRFPRSGWIRTSGRLNWVTMCGTTSFESVSNGSCGLLHYLDAPLEELIERAQRRNASGEWSASPMTRAHFEGWATIFQAPDEEELVLFDEPVTEARSHPDMPRTWRPTRAGARDPGSGTWFRSRDSRRLREQRDAGVYQGRARTHTLHTTWQFSLRASTTMRGMATCSSAATISRTASASSAPPSPCFW